jgi:hypothetical protein
MASAHRTRTRRVGAAARGMAGLRPNRDSTLGCAGHQRAGARLVSGVRTERHSGSQRCGPRRRSRSLHTKAQHVGRFTWTSHGDGEHKDMEGPGAASCRGRPQAHLASLRPRPECAVVRGHSRACARAASPCPLGAAIWRPEAQLEARRRRTHQSLHKKPRHDGRSQTLSSHGDGGAQEDERLRSPLRRGTAVLRLDGQHPGMI